jgi:hypothetical protein
MTVALIGTFYKTYYEANKHLKPGFEILPCDKGFLIVNSNLIQNENGENISQRI